MQRLAFYILIFMLAVSKSYDLMGKKMVACKPVVSLWRTPKRMHVFSLPALSCDLPLHDTQILYGERLEMLEDYKNGWLKVRAIDQPVFDVRSNLWRAVEGWIQAGDAFSTQGFDSCNLVVCSQWAALVDNLGKERRTVHTVSIGTTLKGIRFNDSWWQIALPEGSKAFISCQDVSEFNKSLSDVSTIRKKLVTTAKTFLESPYCSGGRSAWDKTGKQIITSVDCSGLISLVYKVCGFCVPRYAHSQWVRAKTISPQQLAPGDLVFVKYDKDNFNMVRHVMMYIGDELLIEATGLPSICTQTRIVSFQEKFAISLREASNGGRTGNTDSGRIVGERKIYCGSFLCDAGIMNLLRNGLLDPPATRSLGQCFMQDAKGDESEFIS